MRVDNSPGILIKFLLLGLVIGALMNFGGMEPRYGALLFTPGLIFLGRVTDVLVESNYYFIVYPMYYALLFFAGGKFYLSKARKAWSILFIPAVLFALFIVQIVFFFIAFANFNPIFV